jgi:hypothetical protein
MASAHITRPLKPHSREWFKALESSSPPQAKHAAQVIKLMGSDNVCSICGNEESADYLIKGVEFALGVAATVRLCEHCKDLRENGIGAVLLPLSQSVPLC